MTEKTVWQITHSCGHQAERNLSDRAPDRRAGVAEWLAKEERTDCWRAAKHRYCSDQASDSACSSARLASSHATLSCSSRIDAPSPVVSAIIAF